MAIILPTNTICNTIAHNVAYNANYDIIWSFDYSLSGNNTSQGSFTTFLFNGLSSLGGGAPGPGGAYYSAGQYLSGGNTLIVPSVSGAILGINFDTAGLFALSGSTANGLLTSIPKSLSIRYGGTNFNYLTSISLTSLHTDFNLLLSAQEYNRLRFRLTDIGQTLKIDYKVADNFVEILTIPVNLDINDTTTYKIGIGYTTPVSGAAATRAIFSIRDFHVEGKTEVPEYDIIEPINNSFAVYPVCALPGIATPDTPTDIRTIARISDVPCPSIDDPLTERNICLADFVTISGSDSITVSDISVAGLYNLTISPLTAEEDPIIFIPPRPPLECFRYYNGTIAFDGNDRDIVDFPIEYYAPLGPGTGRVGLDYTVYDQSVRFEVEYNNLTVIKTGYVNTSREDIKYNLQRELALRDITVADFSPLSSGTVYFDKTTSEPQNAKVKVYGPVDGASYKIAMFCPSPPPVTYSCGTRITGVTTRDPRVGPYYYTPIIIDLGVNTGTVTFAYSAYDFPQRFQILFKGQIIDTGWVGSTRQQDINWLNEYLRRVQEPTVTTLNSGIVSSVNIVKNEGDPATMEVRVFAPLYNSSWALSAKCPTTVSAASAYRITPSPALVREGETVTFTVNTINVPNGSTLYVVPRGTATSGVDYTGLPSTVTIDNNTKVFTITTVNNNAFEDAETIILDLKTGSADGTLVATSAPDVIINDALPTYAITPSRYNIDEGGDPVNYNIITTNVQNGTTLFATNTGTANNADFNIPFPISVPIYNNAGSFEIRAVQDIFSESPQFLDVQLRTINENGPVVAHATRVTVFDAYPFVIITPSRDTLYETGQYENDTAGTTSVTYTITTTNIPDGAVLYITNVGSASDADVTHSFVGQNPRYPGIPREIIINNNQAGFVLYATQDRESEEQETITIQLRYNVSGEVVAVANNVYIMTNDVGYSAAFIPASYIFDHIETFP